MQAQRFVTRIVDCNLSLQLPESFNHQRVEVIVLELDDGEPTPTRREPHPDIAGRVQIIGGIVSSVPEEAWDLPR